MIPGMSPLKKELQPPIISFLLVVGARTTGRFIPFHPLVWQRRLL
jgi:hypothetical protein